MAAPVSSVFRLPVVVILGATGTGKSKLALHLGRHFGGEIISADSMQVYKGLDIITNKVTKDEQEACPHHLMDFLNPLSRYTVVDFRNKALPIIEKLLKDNRVPVIVGGTNYYIESLLWKVLLEKEDTVTQDLLLESRGDPQSLSIRKKRKHPTSHQDRNKDVHSESVCNSQRKLLKTDSSETSELRLEPSLIDRTSNIEVTSPSTSLTSPEDIQVGVPSGHKVQEPDKGGNESSNEMRANNPATTTSDSTSPAEILSNRLRVGQFSNSEDVVNESEVDEELDNDDLMRIDVEGTKTEELYQILAEIDPARADSLHPNNRRKIIRSLQVYEQLGRPHSEILSCQQDEEGGGPLGGPLRFNNVCILWLQCDHQVLDKRLDGRVEDMISRGLLNELLNFHREYNEERVQSNADSETLYTQGIFQSIGFKEFHPYLILPMEERDSLEAQKLLLDGVEKLRIATRQYARRQNRWVKNRFVRRPGDNVPPVYSLDSTDPTCWDENIWEPAKKILQAIKEGYESPIPPLMFEGPTPSEDACSKHVCDVCDGRVFVGKPQWLGHLKSKRHYKKARKVKLASLMRSYQEKLDTVETTVVEKHQEGLMGDPEVVEQIVDENTKM
ncbi:tRNA dimethylallyltransferase-like [Asterias amurensis]|uniref:tRNA dimethylallyltransferase-like n=1 Tax=Asterias amurensis TaxID=7602 RepID=UPI003AB5A921